MKKYLTKYEFRWALIILLVSLLWTIFEYEMGWHGEDYEKHRYLTFLFIIPLSLCYFLFLFDKRSNRYKKRFKFKHAFNSGMGLTILVALFTIPAQFLIHYFISPNYLQTAQEYAVSNGEMTRLQARDIYTIENYVIFFPLVFLFTGIMLSLVLGHLLKSKSSKSRRR